MRPGPPDLPTPRYQVPLLVRTDFAPASGAAWSRLLELVNSDAASGIVTLEGVDDRVFDGITADVIGTLGAHDSGEHLRVVADSTTLERAELPVALVPIPGVRPGTDRRPAFRVAGAVLADVVVNLGLGNVSWAEFADNADADGVFRGFRDVVRAADELDDAARRAINRLVELTGRPEVPPWSSVVASVSCEGVLPAPPTRIFSTVLRGPSVWLGLGTANVDQSVDQPFHVFLAVDPVHHAQTTLEGVGRVVAAPSRSGARYTWQWRGRARTVPDDTTTIVVSLEPAPQRSTRVQIEHHDVPEELVASVRDLWRYYLRRLEAISAGTIPWGQHPWTPWD